MPRSPSSCRSSAVIADKLSPRPCLAGPPRRRLDVLPDTTAQASSGPSRQAVTARQARTSHSPSATVAGRRSSTRSAPCFTSRPTAAPRSLSSPRPSPPTTSPAISIPQASPIPTSSSAPAGAAPVQFLLGKAPLQLYFCDAYWPAFREIDFLRALRSFAARQRRYGRSTGRSIRCLAVADLARKYVIQTTRRWMET